MDIQTLSCESVIAEVERALRARPFENVPLAAAMHISTCPRCRAGLALLMRAAATAEPDQASCDLCQRDLAAYMDRERADYAGAAVDYPHVWRHLWSCPDCLDDYLTAVAWLEAEQAGTIAPLRLPTVGPIERAIGAIRRIVLERSMLALALPPPQIALSPLRGAGGDGFVLFEDEGAAQPHLTVMVRDSGNGTWQMVVTTNPPVVGQLRLSAGDTRLTAAFLSDGSATINAIPLSLLSDQEAPDLELILLPVRDAGPPHQ